MSQLCMHTMPLSGRAHPAHGSLPPRHTSRQDHRLSVIAFPTTKPRYRSQLCAVPRLSAQLAFSSDVFLFFVFVLCALSLTSLLTLPAFLASVRGHLSSLLQEHRRLLRSLRPPSQHEGSKRNVAHSLRVGTGRSVGRSIPRSTNTSTSAPSSQPST